jgi:hypothetical protein
MRRSSPSSYQVGIHPPRHMPAGLLTRHAVERVEQLAGLSLMPDVLKQAKHICKSTRCEVVVRRFDDAQKRAGGKR